MSTDSTVPTTATMDPKVGKQVVSSGNQPILGTAIWTESILQQNLVNDTCRTSHSGSKSSGNNRVNHRSHEGNWNPHQSRNMFNIVILFDTPTGPRSQMFWLPFSQRHAATCHVSPGTISVTAVTRSKSWIPSPTDTCVLLIHHQAVEHLHLQLEILHEILYCRCQQR